MTTQNIDQLLNEEQPRGGGLNLGSIVLLIGVLVAVGTVGYALFLSNQTQPTTGPAPEFTLTTFAGDEFDLEAARGDVIVLNFWGSWCAPCRDEAPELQAIHEQYADRGVQVIGVTYLDKPEDSLAFIDELGLTYTNAPDPRSQVADAYHIQGAPETFVIDQSGNVADGGFFMGPVTVESLTPLLDDLLLAEAPRS
jgi:cytochrome c biogenesis protein CcmG/thiol:disulfide interchange protein DsbE